MAKERSEYKIILRPHPSETRVVQDVDQNFIVIDSGVHLHSLLHSVDIVVVATSTVGYEASLIGKRVISVDCSVFTDDVPFSKYNISEGVSSPEELSDKIINGTTKNLNCNTQILQVCAVKNVLKVISDLAAI